MTTNLNLLAQQKVEEHEAEVSVHWVTLMMYCLLAVWDVPFNLKLILIQILQRLCLAVWLVDAAFIYCHWDLPAVDSFSLDVLHSGISML